MAAMVAMAGASAVLLGAFGAHALRADLGVHGMELWQTANRYQFWHALALAACLALRGRVRLVAAVAFMLGIVLFSGSLYALALGAPRWTGLLTPCGGLAFLVGWVALGLGLARLHH